MSFLKENLKKKNESNSKDDNTKMEPMNESKTNTLYCCFLIFFVRTKNLDKVFRGKG